MQHELLNRSVASIKAKPLDVRPKHKFKERAVSPDRIKIRFPKTDAFEAGHDFREVVPLDGKWRDYLGHF